MRRSKTLTSAHQLEASDGSRLEDYSWSDEDGPSVDARLAQCLGELAIVSKLVDLATGDGLQKVDMREIPVPGALSALPAPPDTARLQYAHADWAGYSIFEEAFTLGHRAGSV